jgi:hypothetical protein
MTYKGSGIYGDTYTIAAKKVMPGGPDTSLWMSFTWADVG